MEPDIKKLYQANLRQLLYDYLMYFILGTLLAGSIESS